MNPIRAASYARVSSEQQVTAQGGWQCHQCSAAGMREQVKGSSPEHYREDDLSGGRQREVAADEHRIPKPGRSGI